MPTRRRKATRRRKPTRPTQALARREALPPADLSTNPALAFAQLARDKSIDPDKLEKLIHLQERIMDRNAKQAFNAAFTAMADQLPVISRNGRITDKDGRVRSRYSKYEDIQRVCKPILKQFGFAIRHRTEWPSDKPGIIRVVGILSHIEGHSEESAFEAPPDKNNYRTDIQDQGSTVSYGRRYTTIDVLNLEQEGVDNDGQGSENRKRATAAPRASGQPQGASSDGAPRGAQPPPTASRPAGGTRGDQVISDAQRRRMFTIATHAGRDAIEIKKWISGPPYNYASSKDIKRRDYEAICKAIEAKGPLPVREREPGEEG